MAQSSFSRKHMHITGASGGLKSTIVKNLAAAFQGKTVLTTPSKKKRWRLFQVESAIACNLRCLMCPWREIAENVQNRGLMSQEVWDAIQPHLAEVKSVAVLEGNQGRGIGAALVNACIDEAKSLDVAAVFVLTYEPEFFVRFGFEKVDLMELPRKVWGECQRCPKFPDCDEVGLFYIVNP